MTDEYSAKTNLELLNLATQILVQQQLDTNAVKYAPTAEEIIKVADKLSKFVYR